MKTIYNWLYYNYFLSRLGIINKIINISIDPIY